MRMRTKKWARPELAACDFFIKEPARQIGRWKDLFEHPENPVHLELGCGKGVFLSKLACDHPEINYIGIDLSSDVLGVARRLIVQEYEQAGRPIDNVKILSFDIELILRMLGESDEIQRIYINFCNPWPKAGNHKKRLTHTRQLLKYRTFLQENGEIWFKTDDDDLFLASQGYFQESGYLIEYLTKDLHRSGFTPNYPTEHEERFTAEGIPTKFLIARKGVLEKLPIEEKYLVLQEPESQQSGK